MIKVAAWDSQRFAWRAGRIDEPRVPPSGVDLEAFDHVLVRVPIHDAELQREYAALGFGFVTIDYALEMQAGRLGDVPAEGVQRLARQAPDFVIDGFSLTGSRFHIDPSTRIRLPSRFWDEMIADHCRDFADFCLCIVSADRRLLGFASCFELEASIEIFLLAVHADARSAGLGGKLVQTAGSAARRCGKKLVTNVVAHNIEAMRFYGHEGFLPVKGEVVMHFTRTTT